MLCPEVVNFPPPKTMCRTNQKDSLDSVIKTVCMNSFYKSVIITCPDEIRIPTCIVDNVTEDTEYYKVSDCSLTEFVEPTFIENFVKKGNLYCLSANRNCIVENCAAITPDGILTVHVIDFIFQTLGFEGKKRPHNYYEVNIDLKNIKHSDKVKQGLAKLELFNFMITWEPHDDSICPSSLAKYFHDRNLAVSSESLTIRSLTPDIREVPSIKDVEPEEMVEWVGMLALEGDLVQNENYISTYYEPESEFSLKSTRMSLLVVKGFMTPSLLETVCRNLSDIVISNPLDNYWMSVSIQSQENCLWQWNPSTPKMFQAHDSSYNAFFSKDGVVTYSMGQIKYS